MQLKRTCAFAAALLLSSCAAWYGLSEEEYAVYTEQYNEVKKYNHLLTFENYIHVINHPYSEGLKDTLCAIDYQIAAKGEWVNLNTKKCPAEKYEKNIQYEDILETAKAGKMISLYSVEDIIETRKDKELEAARQQWELDKKKEQDRLMKKYEKKYGKKFCSEPLLNIYILRNMAVPSDCMVYSDNLVFEVSQQIQDGTLVSVAYPQYIRNLLIAKNKKDTALVTGQNVPAGIFIGQGNYTYTTIFGATNTVSKLKRLD